MTHCLAAASVLLASILSVHGGAVAEEEIQQKYAVSPMVVLSVRNGDGRIMIYGSEENEIKITALKRAFTKERLDRIELKVTIDGDTATIDTIYPPPPEGRLEDRSGTVDYTIIVPETCAISKAELASGELVFEGLRGAAIHGQLGAGRLMVRDCFSQTRVSVRRGGLDVLHGWWEDRGFSVAAEIADGNVRLSLPATAAFRVQAAAPKGDIQNAFAEKGTEKENQRVLDMRIGGDPQVEFKLTATDGNIRIDQH